MSTLIKKVDTVDMKRRLQNEAEQRLSHLSEKEQLKLLHKRFGHLMKRKEKVHIA